MPVPTADPVSDSVVADVLAIAAHRDDVEQTCGGTLLRMASRGLRTAILDLTQGEAGTRGTVEERGREASEAASLLGVSWREALNLPDGAVENTFENRVRIARVVRQLRPRVVILPYWQARHPDHATTATVGYEACFLSGLARITTGQPPHRPFKIVYASLYADVRPSFIVDITPFIDQRHKALMAYRSQYASQPTGSALFVPEEEIRERTFAEARHYGLFGGVRYGEPFVQKEVGLVDDLTLLPVQSI
ncbi:MAG: bacillithiol biosynthesis deacetylase BshB1 [Terracidiphilus sp.]